MGLLIAMLLGFLLVVAGLFFLAVRFSIAGWTIGVTVCLLIIGYGLETKGPLTLSDLLFLGLGFVAGGALLGICYGLYRLVKKIPGYLNVCPVRA